MGIKNRLFAWISLILIVMGGFLAYLTLPLVEQSVKQKTAELMSSETENVALQMDTWFSERGQILKATAIQLEINGLGVDNPQFPYVLDELAGSFRDKFNYMYVGFSNKVQITTRSTKPPTGFDPTSRLWYRAAMANNGLVVTEPYPDIQTRRFSVSIAFPVKTAIPGVIGTDLYIDDLELLAAKVLFHPDAEAVLISKQGTVLYSKDNFFGSPGESLDSASRGIYEPFLKQIASQKKGLTNLNRNGVPYLVQFSSVPTAGWTIAVALPESVFYQEAKRILNHTIGILLFGLLMIFMVIYFIIVQITKPLETITSIANKLGNGDLTQTFPSCGTKEVKNLAASLESMRGNLLSLLEEKDGLLEETRAQNAEIGALYQQMKALNSNLAKAYDENETAYVETIKALADAIEAKDCFTRGHSDRVLFYAEKTAVALGWDENQKKLLKFAAILHDIGKIAIPLEILNKPGKLDVDEYEIVKTHSEIGYKILKNISYLDVASSAVLQHHERPDGQGYPLGLRGNEISALAKVLAVVDAFDAMTSERPYKKIMTKEEACEELIRSSGKQFDSFTVQTFCNVVLSELEI